MKNLSQVPTIIGINILLLFMQSCIDPVVGPAPTSTIIKGTILQTGTLLPVEGALIVVSVNYFSENGANLEYAFDSLYTDSSGE